MVLLDNILVATDFSDASEAAITYGRELAWTFGSRLHVLHVIKSAQSLPATENWCTLPSGSPPRIEGEIRTQLDSLLSEGDRRTLRLNPVVLTSPTPAAAIVDYARAAGIDLIVVGTHSRTCVARLVLGSVADRVLQTASCPVLAVRRPEHEFVVADALVTAAPA